ncbi:MAG: sodium:solute symporter family protein [Clostridia bacterium]|nr:sodium:solute symporter family protein [Clostridia bacterium]
MVLKVLLVVVFFAVMVGVGLYCRRHATDVNGFVLGGRSVGPWLTAFAYGTSYFSAVIFVGYAGQFGWRFGIASTWIGLGNDFIGSLLAWIVLGRRTRLMTQHLSAATMPEFFGKRYQSNALKIGASAIVFIFLIPYTASLYNGLSRLFGMAFNIDYTVCVIAMAVLTGIYVIAGGYMATAVNDFIQGIIMIGGIIAVIAAVLSQNGGFIKSMEGLSLIENPATPDFHGVFASFLGPNPLDLLFVVLLTSLGTWGLPQMVQKFYAIKNEGAITKGTVISTVFAVIVAGGCYFLGGFGRLFTDVIGVTEAGTPVGGFDAVVPAMLQNLPDILLGVLVILVLSASMSTLSSLVLASSSTLTLDFIKGNIVKDMDEKKQVFIMRVLIVFFILVSVIIAIVQYKGNVTFIAQMMGISWGALAGAFLAPFLYGLYWKRTTKAGCWASFIFGCGLMIYNMLFKATMPAFLQSPINSGVIAMLAGLVIVPVVSLFTKAPDRSLVNDAFSCYDAKVLVHASQSLGGDETGE